jgi:sn-glycerol 3-phosphate transport system ATP-binding protein
MNVFAPPAGVGAPDGVLLGIRPEDVAVGAGIALAVELVEPLGGETLVHGVLPGGERLTLKRPGGPPGVDTLLVNFPEAARHYFEVASGRRL